ncbi:MAG: LemA family protein [Rikenellaceae bacterium]
MSKKTITLIVVAAAALILYFSLTSSYNSMVTQEETVTSTWSNVENQYQRRADLIPNLVNTVKGYASHESETLTGVTEARANATKVTIDANNLNEQSLAAYNRAQGELSSALSKLLMVSENYPDLKANQNFLELQSQLEGTENRISTERKRFNDAVKEYNASIRKFPRNLMASMFGFEPKAYFEAQEGSQNAPTVEF